jgi:hypothetical protein
MKKCNMGLVTLARGAGDKTLVQGPRDEGDSDSYGRGGGEDAAQGDCFCCAGLTDVVGAAAAHLHGTMSRSRMRSRKSGSRSRSRMSSLESDREEEAQEALAYVEEGTLADAALALRRLRIGSSWGSSRV